MERGLYLMCFKKIIIFSVKDYNANKPIENALPQTGIIINVFHDGISGQQCVAVGFTKWD